MIIYKYNELFWKDSLPSCPKSNNPDHKCLGDGCFPASMDDFCSSAMGEGYFEIGFCNCICWGCPGAAELMKKGE